MTSYRDIYATARLLIKQHGDDAETYASEQMHAFMEKDDAKGASVWLAICSAIDDLQNISRQGKLH
jgi:hypothetical protein